MSSHYLLLLLCATTSLQRGPSRSSTTASTDTSTAASDTSTTDDDYVTLVKGYIDAGTCGEVSTGTNCGDSATSYYNEFEYNGQRVVVASGVPDHDAENDAVKSNPNTRCERWTFMSVPIDPTKADSGTVTDMGVVSLAVTGGTFYNYLSSPSGDVALYNEGESLDSCMGHSSSDGQYHYHANILCTEAGAATGASDADQCVLIGYMRDGVPVYGYCKDTSGTQFTSCYSLKSTSTTDTITTAAGDFVSASSTSDYEYDQDAFDAGSCNLDEGNGATHPTTGQYAYFLTAGYPWVPIYYYGEDGASSLCSAE